MVRDAMERAAIHVSGSYCAVLSLAEAAAQRQYRGRQTVRAACPTAFAAVQYVPSGIERVAFGRQPLQFLRRAVAAESAVTVRKAAKARDQVAALHGGLEGVVEYFVRRSGCFLEQPPKGSQGFLLHIETFGVHQRHIEEQPLD